MIFSSRESLSVQMFRHIQTMRVIVLIVRSGVSDLITVCVHWGRACTISSQLIGSQIDPCVILLRTQTNTPPTMMMASGVPSPTAMMIMINVENASAGGSPMPINTVLRVRQTQREVRGQTNTIQTDQTLSYRKYWFNMRYCLFNVFQSCWLMFRCSVSGVLL